MRLGISAPGTPARFDGLPDVPSAARASAPRIGRGGLGCRAGRGAPVPLSARREPLARLSARWFSVGRWRS